MSQPAAAPAPHPLIVKLGGIVDVAREAPVRAAVHDAALRDANEIAAFIAQATATPAPAPAPSVVHVPDPVDDE